MVRPEFGGRPALLVNVSAVGAAFVLGRPVEVGDMVTFEVHGAGGEGPRRAARVRHCHPCPSPAGAPWLPQSSFAVRFCRRLFGFPVPQGSGEAWFAGCTFTRPLNEEELEELLAHLGAGGE